MFHLFITSGMLLSQSLFANVLGGSSYDYAWSVIQTSDGGLAVAGYTNSFGAGEYDFLILKMTSDGSLSWAKVFGGTAYEQACSVVQTLDGGFAIAGRTMSFGAGGSDFLVLKLTSDGSLQWVKTFGETDWDEAFSITVTSDGGLAVAGRTRSTGAGSADFMILKLASDGTFQWAKTFGGADWDDAFSITGTSDGGLAVAGRTASFGAGSEDFLILKLASDGSLGWVKTLGGGLTDYAHSIIETSDNGLAVAGYTKSFGAGDYDLLVFKMGSDGTVQWAKTFGGDTTDYAYSITETSDNGLAVAGYTKSFGAVGGGSLVVKLAADGTLQWNKLFQGTDFSFAYSITQTLDGGVVAAGYDDDFSASDENCMVLKLGSDGEYPGCVDTCTFIETTPSLIENLLSENVADYSPTISDPTVQVNDPGIVIDTLCSYVNISETRMTSWVPGIRYSPAPGGALFSADQATDLRLYSVDGRLIRSLRLEQGQNRVSLDKGVYLWQAGPYKGKAVVR